MKRTWIVAGVVAALALSGCARKTALEPAPGQDLPPVPYGASEPPSSTELLELDPQAAPQRSTELRRRSEEREDDPFDIPPE
ncbi:hypothetical protein GRI38_01690 [Altererythrobacter aurantiacus]|uniref:Argininosuccinate lyase n=1 Tax=Parapontixanthobacter aurantiacus TaxID=1463599 RepID=A0A844ZCM4_9SPHN|nr:hypothetical protein [Parapontixanthobacter aurantiacus]MXO84747.1 hypothetical protein [Parapontixanthobacter aurantiacus]